MESLNFFEINLTSDYSIDQSVLDEDEKILFFRFGQESNTRRKIVDLKISHILSKVNDKFKFFSVDNKKVYTFNLMYELPETDASVFFFKNKRVLVDHGTGNNNKIEKPFFLRKNFLKLLEIIYWTCKKGKNFIFFEQF